MLEFLLSAIQAPFLPDQQTISTATALMAASAAGGLFISRKQFRKIRRKMIWTAIKEKIGLARNRNYNSGGCLFWLLAGLLVIILAFILWKVALVLLVVLLIIWLIRYMNHQA